MSDKNTFYITTAIDYPNGKPHLGHAYEKLVTDTYARWARFIGKETFFLTGTDENGQKLQLSAEKAGAKDVMSFVTENSDGFKQLCGELKISNDDFIRTTEKRHIETAQKLWTKLVESGDLFLGSYEGMYCFDCEQFYPENQAEDGMCPSHNIPLTHVKEEGYKFKLSKYHGWIQNYIESNEDFIFPKSAREEMLGRLRSEPLKDLSFSRLSKGWGIPVPGDDKHVIYTWGDALINYFTPIANGDFPEKAWPADKHIIGKDISWFHIIIWPCMLHALGMELPKQVHVHGMVLDENGKKMSKSLGNVIDPYEMMENFPNDTIRYYLLRGVPSGSDGKASMAGLKSRHNNELANELGNLVNRAIKLSLKKISPSISSSNHSMEFNLEELIVDDMKTLMESNLHHKALDKFWEGVSKLNTYLNDKEPWKIKDDPESFGNIMYTCLHGVYVLAVMAKAFMPKASEKMLCYLGVEDITTIPDSFPKRDFELTDPKPLFMRMD